MEGLKSKLLIVYAGKTTTAEILIRLMDEYAKIRKVEVRAKEVLSLSSEDINWSDTPIAVRGADFFLSRIIIKAKKNGKQCVLYLDDDLLSLYGSQSDYYSYLIDCFEHIDILWGSNKRILERCAPYISKDTKCVDAIVLDPWNEVQKYTNESENVKIVFAGSPSHESVVLRYILPALDLLYSNYNKIEVIFVGYKNTSLDNAAPFIKTTEWFDDVDAYRNYLVEEGTQIGLAVVEDSQFGKCKFYNKFFEYTKLGVVGIYSNCEPYTMIIKDGENGFLTNNSVRDWASTIMKVINESDLRRKCVENAQKLLYERFSTKKIIQSINESIPELEDYRSEKSEIKYNARMLIYCYRIKRLISFFVHPIKLIDRIKR